MILAKRLRLLRWVLSVLGVVSVAGCKGGQGGEEYLFEFPLSDEIYKPLTASVDSKTLAHVYVFAPLVRIPRRDEPVDATAYVAVTMADGSAATGKYALKATLRRGYTGGPLGSATEQYVQVDDVHLVEKLKPPPAGPGVRAILPGQGIVRNIPVGGIDALDDRYVVELPANMPAEIWLLPSRDEYDLDVTVTRNSVSLPTTRLPDDYLYLWNSYKFRTTSAGVYEVRVRRDAKSALEPDSYMICVGFGAHIRFGSDEAVGSHKVKFREHRSASNPGTR